MVDERPFGLAVAAWIRDRHGRYLLLNGGPSASLLADGLGRRMPLFQREFDWWVVASPQQHQVAALPTMVERYPPTNVLWAGLPSASRQADYLRDALKTGGVPTHSAMTGDVLDLGNGAVLEVLAA